MKKGFTLLELVIVLAIIAVLSAISYPLYSGYKERVYRAEAEEALISLSAVQEDYFNSYRKYSKNLNNELENFYGVNITGDHFKITVTTKNNNTSYTATAHVCYVGSSGSSCNSTNYDAVCTISNGDDKAECEQKVETN